MDGNDGLNVAICDDEAEIRAGLSELVRAQNGVTGIDEFANAEDLLASSKRYHLIFLDIQMPGVNGVEAARQLRLRSGFLCIVFVTGAKEYVFDAFDVGALHYLLKPIDAGKFSEIFHRAYLEYAKYDASLEKKLLIRTKKSAETISRNDILYVESQLKKLDIHTSDRTITFYGTIQKLERQLGEAFYRCHRSYLVNMAYVAGYDGDTITLTDGARIYLSKNRYADFAQAYLKYLRDGGACFV